MDRHLKNRLIKSLGSSSFNQAVTVAIQLVSMPVLLRLWGAEVYGEWLALSAIPAYLAMSDLGFGAVTGSEMTMCVAAGSKDKALTVFQSAFVVVTAVSSALALLSIVAAWALPVGTLFNVRHIPAHEAKLVLSLLAVWSVFCLQDVLMGAGFVCAGRYGTGMFTHSVTRLFEPVAVIVTAWYGGSPLAGAAAQLVVRVVGLAVRRSVLRRVAPWVRYDVRRADLATARALAPSAVAFLGFPIGNMLSNQGLIILINVTLGPTRLVVFMTLRTLSRLGFQVMNVINQSVWPEMSAAYGAGDLVLARRLHRLACQYAIWISLAIVACLAVAGRWIVTTWTRGQVPYDPLVFDLLLGLVVVNSLWYTSLVVPMATNRHHADARNFLLGCTVSLALAAVSVRGSGLVGVTLSLFATDLFMTFSVVRRSLRLVDDDLPGFLRAVLSPPALGALSWRRGKPAAAFAASEGAT